MCEWPVKDRLSNIKRELINIWLLYANEILRLWTWKFWIMKRRTVIQGVLINISKECDSGNHKEKCIVIPKIWISTMSGTFLTYTTPVTVINSNKFGESESVHKNAILNLKTFNHHHNAIQWLWKMVRKETKRGTSYFFACHKGTREVMEVFTITKPIIVVWTMLLVFQFRWQNKTNDSS